MRMEIGVFDHLDRSDLPLPEYYEARLQLIAAYERAGFYAYHLAEHHSTPLGMAPSPRQRARSISSSITSNRR